MYPLYTAWLIFPMHALSVFVHVHTMYLLHHFCIPLITIDDDGMFVVLSVCSE